MIKTYLRQDKTRLADNFALLALHLQAFTIFVINHSVSFGPVTGARLVLGRRDMT